MLIIRTPAGEAAMRVLQETLRRVDAGTLVRQTVWRDGESLSIAGTEYLLEDYDRVRLFAMGKAASSMAAGLEEILGDKLSDGLIVTKYGHQTHANRLPVVEAGHPIPDENSLRAGAKLLHMAGECEAKDLVIVAISGGTSSLVESPAPPLSISDIGKMTNQLLLAGADIQDLNRVRSFFSQFKAGGFARALAPAQVVVLLLSDVIGNDRATIGSGPCYGAPPKRAEVEAILARYGVICSLPVEFDTPFADPPHVVIGDIYTLLEEAQRAAESLGLRPKIYGGIFSGEARNLGAEVAAEAIGLVKSDKDDCYIAAGETTVTVRGGGQGGRNQEVACAAALAIAEVPDVAVLAVGTDGSDGPTEAAGGLVDGVTHTRCDLRRALDHNDSYHALLAADALVELGPTGTNLNDLVIVVRNSSLDT